MYKKIIIILILISGLNCFSMLEKAKNSFSQGNIVDAVEYYRQALVISENQKQTLEAISGLGACYVELGLKERAQFYYERYLDMEEDQAILEKLLNILIELEKFNQAEKYLTNLTDDFNRNKYMAVICEKRNNFKQAAAYYKKMYEFSNSLSYLDKALDYDISLYKDFNNSLEADIVYYSINQDSDSLEKTVLKFEKAGRNELFRLYEYFFHKNNILLVNVAEKLYELNKNVSDISRLIRAYYKFGQINKVNNFLNVIEEKMPAETIVNLLHNTFMELSMYDRALSYIKKIPNYQKNPDFFIKILDIYSAGMSYSLYYDEIEKLYISRIIDENFVNSRITSLLRARKEWADSFLSHSVRNHVTEYVLALGFHYSAKYDEAVKVLYNLDDNTRKQFFNYTNSIFIYADKVDYSKLESETLIMMMPYMSAENLFELVLLEKFDVVNTALFKLVELKKITIEEVYETVHEKFNIDKINNEIILKLNDLYSKLTFSSSDMIIVQTPHKIKTFTENYLRLKRYSLSFNNTIITEYDPLLKIGALIYFTEIDFAKTRNIYEQGRLQRDFLYTCAVVGAEENPHRFILNEFKWVNLELYKIFKLEQGENYKEKIKQFYFEAEKI